MCKCIIFALKFKNLKMITNRTFTMLKPDSVEKGNIGAIMSKINAAGFKILALKLTKMSVSRRINERVRP